MSVVVVGNGESRRSIDLSAFKNKILIGCNAIHRDFKVDHLVCCDRRMIEEAIKNPNITNTQIYVRHEWVRHYRKIEKNKNVHEVPILPYIGDLKQDRPEHWGSGVYAALLATTLGFKDITLIGFDLYPTNKLVNNVYKGTVNYAAADKQGIDYSHWVYQLSKVFQYNADIQFTIVNNQSWTRPKEWQHTNLRFKNIIDL